MSAVLEAHFGFGLAYAALAATPGANFLLISQISLSAPRRTAFCAALGVAFGAGLTAFAVIAGSDLLRDWEDALRVVEALWALLLLRLGLRALLRAGMPGSAAPRAFASSACGSFRLGLLAAVSNPVTFAFLLGAAASVAGGPVGGSVTVFLIALGWFGMLALALSDARMRSAFARLRPVLDLVAGAFFFAFGSQTLLALAFR